jgi:ABC-type lipoprotein release transport system permease subunit
VNVDFRVVGILHTGDAALDAIRAVANLTDVRHLLGLPDRAHELAIRVDDPSGAAAVAETLGAKPEFQGLDVKTWKQLRPDVVAMVQTNSALTAMMVAIIFAVAAIGVADTILMAVFERRRELGVLKAVGMRPASIVTLITIETFLLGLFASLVGVGLGVGIDLYLARVGIPLTSLSSFTLAGASIPPVIHATMTLEGVLSPLAMMVVAALLAALWPAFVAARTEPVIAMQDR